MMLNAFLSRMARRFFMDAGVVIPEESSRLGYAAPFPPGLGFQLAGDNLPPLLSSCSLAGEGWPSLSFRRMRHGEVPRRPVTQLSLPCVLPCGFRRSGCPAVVATP